MQIAWPGFEWQTQQRAAAREADKSKTKQNSHLKWGTAWSTKLLARGVDFSLITEPGPRKDPWYGTAIWNWKSPSKQYELLGEMEEGL